MFWKMNFRAGLLISIIAQFVVCYIKLPFKRYHPRVPSTEEDFLKMYYKNYLGVELEAGTPRQKVNLIVSYDDYAVSLYSSTIQYPANLSNITTFKEKESSTLKVLSRIPQFFLYSKAYYQGKKANETFSFQNYTLEDFSFILSLKMKDDHPIEVGDGVLGLSLQNVDKKCEGTNFISTLKEKGIIEGYPFFINYTGEDEGEIIIGKYPHEIEPEKYKKKLYKKTYAKSYSYETLNWGITFNKIVYGEEIISDPTDVPTALFTFDLGYIVTPYKYLESVNRDFFQRYIDKNLCSKVQLMNKYEGFYCKKVPEVKLEELNNLTFYNHDLNMTFILTYKDLFYEHEYTYYFLATSTEGRGSWKFGKPFLKKYLPVFNQDSKQISFYVDEKPLPFNWSRFWNILFCVIIFALVLVIFYLIYKKINSRKRRATELIEDFDYSSASN